MSTLSVLQLLDKFLANYHLGHAVFLLFVLTLPAGIVKKSIKLMALTMIAFGGLFLVVPSISDASATYSFFGMALMVLGPLAFTMSDR